MWRKSSQRDFAKREENMPIVGGSQIKFYSLLEIAEEINFPPPLISFDSHNNIA